MANHTEVETKFELDAPSFERLRNEAQVQKYTDQLNVYYDRAWRLANLAATFRVRLVRGETPVFTLKLPISINHGTRVAQEFEFEYHLGAEANVDAAVQPSEGDLNNSLPVEIDVDRELPPDVTDALLRVGVNRLEIMGCVRNRRYFLSVSDVDAKIALDQLQLPGGRTVYEAELESDDPDTHVRFKSWILSHFPGARQSPMSKFQRLQAALAGPSTTASQP